MLSEEYEAEQRNLKDEVQSDQARISEYEDDSENALLQSYFYSINKKNRNIPLDYFYRK